MATRRRRRGLGKLYKKTPAGCSCAGKGTPIRVGKFGIRCMTVRKVGGRKRFVFSNTAAKCNA